MQEIRTKWGTRQSPSNKRPSRRLMWKSHFVWYDGIPVIPVRNTGHRATMMECEFGPRRKGTPALKARIANFPAHEKRPRQSEDDDNEDDGEDGGDDEIKEEKLKISKWSSASSGKYRSSCPTRINIRKITKFSFYRPSKTSPLRFKHKRVRPTSVSPAALRRDEIQHRFSELDGTFQGMRTNW